MTKQNIKNKGTGAGGKNTNANGLPYEELTDLSTHYEFINSDSKEICFKSHKKSFIIIKQGGLFSVMKDFMNHNVTKAHGCKNPDECYIDNINKHIFIIEKKFQQTSGSVCEKIQTADFKLWQYGRTFPYYKIVYIYCLSDWFKENCKAELEYLEEEDVPVFWGNDSEYKTKIIDFMVNYK